MNPKRLLIITLIMLATFNACLSSYQLSTWITAAIYWLLVLIYWEMRLIKND